MAKLEDLPDEILSKVFKRLSARDLAVLARVSRKMRRVAEKKSLWRDLLKEDFHFTKDTVWNQSFGDFRSAYRYANRSSLNKNQRSALMRLQSYGLTEQHLKGRVGFSSEDHENALISLLRDRKMSPTNAMAELDGFDREQAKGISQGLTRSKVIGLKEMQVVALQELHTFGLTAAHLRGRDWFSSYDHYLALKYLMCTRQMSAEDAMAELDGLNENQADAIAHSLIYTDGRRSLTRAEVIGLNRMQIVVFKNCIHSV